MKWITADVNRRTVVLNLEHVVRIEVEHEQNIHVIDALGASHHLVGEEAKDLLFAVWRSGKATAGGQQQQRLKEQAHAGPRLPIE